MTFFSHRPCFSDFPYIFTNFPYLYSVKCMTLSSRQKALYFRKLFFGDIFLNLCSYFRAHPGTLLLKILGDGCMGRPPTSIFLGRPSPSPSRSPSPPMLTTSV